jgi:lysophospholipase L1-like esterase
MTRTDLVDKWLKRFADNDTFEIDEADFREFTEDLAATFAEAGYQQFTELVLPQAVVASQWYVDGAGIWEARRTFQASVSPVNGPNWRQVVSFTGQATQVVTAASITDATDAGRKMLKAPNAAAQRALLSDPKIEAGVYGNHPAWKDTDNKGGLYEWLIKNILSLAASQPQVVSAPAAPTAGQVDDTADTFSFVPNPAFPSFAQYKVNGLPGITGAVVLDAINSYVSGNRIYIKVVGAVAKGGLAVYVAGSGNVPDGAVLTNADPFTGAIVVAPPTTTTPALTAALAISVASIVAGSPLTFTVTAGGGTSPYSYAVVATNNSTGATTVLGSSASGSFTPQTPNTSYNLDATVTDAAGKVAQAVTRTVQVTAAQTVNQMPVADAGADLTIQLPTSSVVLLGTASDPDAGDTLTYLWRPITGPNTPVGLPATTLNAVISNLIAGTYQFGFQATDNKGGKSTEDFVVVTVNAASTAPATSLTPTPADYHFSANILRQNGAGQNLHAGLSVLKVGFSGNAMTIRPFATGGSGNVYVKDSGGFAQSFSPAAAGQSYALANLTPPVFLTTGGQQRSYERGDVQGADYLDLSFPNGATGNFLPFQQTKRAIAVFNDSIGQGATLPLCQTQAWTMLLRQAGHNVTTLGYGSGTGSVMLGAANRVALKAQLHLIWDGASEQVGVFSLFTNDYGGAGGGSAANGGGSPSAVRALLVDFLQDMKTEFANAKFLILTPFYRGDENNGNSYGAVLEDYRAVITSAASAFPNVTVRSGKGILVPGSDYTPGDVVHPNPAGHVKIFNFVEPAIDSLYNTASSTDLVDLPGLANTIWAQFTNTGQTNLTLNKIAGGLNWDAGAVADHVLGATAGPGVKGQLHIPGNQISRGSQVYSSSVIGLSDSPPDYTRTSTVIAGTPVAYITIATAFYFDAGGYGLIEAGQEQPFVYVPWTVGVYTDFDMQYTQGAVKFYVGRKLFYTSAFDPTPYPYLYVAACLLNQGVSTVKGITMAGVNLLPTPTLGLPTSTEQDASTRRYSANWVDQTDPLYSTGAGRYNAGPNDGSSWFEESFTGTSVIYWAVTNAGSGTFDMLIDGQLAVSGTSYSGSTQASHEVARVTGLPAGNHVIRVVKTGGGSLYADKLVYPDGNAIP